MDRKPWIRHVLHSLVTDCLKLSLARQFAIARHFHDWNIN
jgi:hypothetical protein